MSERTNENKKEIKDEIKEGKAEETNKEGKINKDSEKNEKKGKNDGKEKKSVAREIMEWIVCIVIAFSLALFIKYVLFTPTLVMQQSMTPTILDGERVLINRLVRMFDFEINRGDIITFEEPAGSTVQSGGITAVYYEKDNIIDSFLYNVMEIGKRSYIKRVIGLEGDKIRIENGRVYLNDKLLEEEYLQPEVRTYIDEGGMPSEFVVPEGYVFAMGDNRAESSDCRFFGCIPREKVEGRVTIRIWPLNKIGAIDE